MPDQFDPFIPSSPTRTENRRARQGPSDPRTFNWVSDSKKKIGQSRYNKGTVSQVGPNEWVVQADPSKGDAYEQYEVSKTGKKHTCSCQGHAGGEFRRGLCTHSVAAMIYTYEESQTWTPPAPRKDTKSTEPSGENQNSQDPVSGSALSADSLIQELASQSQLPLTPPKKRRRRRPAVNESSPSTVAPSSSTSTLMEASASTATHAGDAVPVTSVPGTWPSWLSGFRPHQLTVADEIVEAFKDVDVVYLDGPTGSGKSLIGWIVAQKMGVGKAVLLTQDKALQDQYLRDFEEVGARTIKGRANYIPQISTDMSGLEVTCDDCTYSAQQGCDYCPEPNACPYRSAKAAAVDSPLGVLNYAYFIREAGSARAQFSDQDLIIADECDVLENVLLSAAEVVYSASLRRSLNLGQPAKLVDDTGHAYLQWLQDVVHPKLEAEHKAIKTRESGVERRRKLKRSQSKLDETTNLIETMLDDGDLNWVLTGYTADARKKLKEGPMIFKPVRVGNYGHKLLWRHGRKLLLMSATIVSSDELSDSLGYDRLTHTIMAPMPFDVERRLINLIPMARLTRKTEEEATPKIVEGVLKVLERWPDERAIIHTVSYRLTETVKSAILLGSKRTVFTYRDSKEKESIIAQFEATPAAVLVGPSIARGADFKGDKARVNIICKMPWASLGDAQIKARKWAKGGDAWYVTKAVREIVQASGRTTRSEDDWGVTYILDASIVGVIKENRHLFPAWFLEALRRVKPSTLLRGGVIPEPEFHK